MVVQAKYADVSNRPGVSTVLLGEGTLCVILDEEQAPLVGQHTKFGEPRCLPKEIDGEDRSRPGSDGGLDGADIEREGLRVNICETRGADRSHRGKEAGSGGIDRYGMANPEPGAPRGLEFFDGGGSEKLASPASVEPRKTARLDDALHRVGFGLARATGMGARTSRAWGYPQKLPAWTSRLVTRLASGNACQ